MLENGAHLIGSISPEIAKQREALHLTIKNSAVVPGEEGFIDIVLEGNKPIAQVQYKVTINSESSLTNILKFSYHQSDFDPLYELSDYIFNEHSANKEVSLPEGNMLTTILPNDTFLGGDGTNDNSEVLPGSGKIIAHIPVTMGQASAEQPCEEYVISISSGSTLFTDAHGNHIPYSVDEGVVKMIPKK